MTQLKLGLRRGMLLCLVLALFAALWFTPLATKKLTKTDEGRYAEIGREMALSGDLVTPRLNGIKYFEKPPLQYWATAAAIKVFGVNEFAARFWTGLTSFLTILLVAWTAWQLRGARAGVAAGAVLGGNLYWAWTGHFNSLDAGVAAWLALTLCGVLLAEHWREDVARARRWMLLAWLGMALATLSKGLMGVVLPGMVLGAAVVLTWHWRFVARLHIFKGIALLLLVCAPWFVAVARANPEFLHFFFIHEHWERFTSDTHRREGAWWTFFPLLLGGLLPFVTLLPGALRTAWRDWRADQAGGALRSPFFLCTLWAGLIFSFFSMSSSKLPGYLTPIFPALAILIGCHVSTLDGKQLARHAWLAAIAFGVGATGLALGFGGRSAYTAALAWACGLAALLMVIGCLKSRAHQASWGISLGAISVAGLIVGTTVVVKHDVLHPQQSGWQVAQIIRPQLTPATQVYSMRYYDQSIPFYLERTVTLVDYVDEFETGLKTEPHLALDSATFAQRWASDASAFAIIHPTELHRFAKLPHTILLQDARRLVLKKP